MPLQKQFDTDEALEKAMLIFWEHGYEATSMEDLVQGMGINRGSLYGTFGGKRSLFLSALHRYDLENRHKALSHLEQMHTPLEAIRSLFQSFADPAAHGLPAKGCFITNCALELAPHDGEVSAIVANAQKQMEEFFVRMIEKGQQQGTINAKIESKSVAEGLLAQLLGLVVLSRSRPEKALLKTIVEDALRRLD